MKVLHILIIILTVVFVLAGSLQSVFAICCFPYDTNYYIDPITGDFVLYGELINDSYRGEPFGNADYRFAFFDKERNSILERNILVTGLLPIKGGVVIPPPAAFPFQVTLGGIDSKVIQKSENFGVDGTNTLDYFAWKPADLVIPSSKITSVGTIHGKNGDVFTKWQISGNITNTHSQKTHNVYVVASLRDKNYSLLGVAGYSDDSIQPLELDGLETKGFTLYALVPASKTPSWVNLYAESDESSFVHEYYRPLKLQIPPPYENKITTDPRKPVMISANITNTSRQSFDLDWIIQIKKSPQSGSDGNLSKDYSKVIHIQKIPTHIDGQESIRLDYSWIPQANGVYSYEMYLWDDSKPLSYAFTGTFLHDNWILVNSNLNSIKNQILSGIPLEQIQCREGLLLVHKSTNANLVCVKPQSMPKLIERGWISCTKNPNMVRTNPCVQYDASDLTSPIFSNQVIIPKGSSNPEQKVNLIPQTLTITLSEGGTVIWVNQDDVPSTLVSDDDGWTTGLIKPGESASVSFNHTGAFNYHGSPHPWKIGTVIVKEK